MWSRYPTGHSHQEAGLVGLDALLQRLLDVDGAANAVLCGAQRQLHLHSIAPLLAVCDFQQRKTAT
jgi:hypothetical protein